MKNILRNICLVALLASGCTPEPLVVTQIPTAESKLVVSTIWVPNVGLSLSVTQNFSALNGGFEDDAGLLEQLLVDDLAVTLSSGGEEVILDELTTGVYGGTQLDLEVGQSYDLEIVDAGNARSVRSTSVVKDLISFEDLDVKLVENSFDEDSLPSISFSVVDPPGQNWYMVNFQEVETDLDIVDTFLDNRIYTHLFTDEGRDGQVINEEFIALINGGFHIGDTVMVTLSNIGKDYYDFLELRNNSDLAFSFVSEPFNFPSNIENGYGFFNLHRPDIRVSFLEE